MTQQQEISAAFPYESKYVDVLGSRMHYVEEGSGDPVLFLHGNPTSSYVWRNIIPHVSPLGRCIALDLIGMGRSDKPDIEYSFFDHSRYVEGFIEALALQNITFVIHDWGSALGFHYARRHEDNVKGIAFMEAFVRPITWDEWPDEARPAFQAFRAPGTGEQMIMDNNMFVELVLPAGIGPLRKLSDEEMNRYREPYPDRESRKPLWRWPNQLPIEGHPPEVCDAVRAYSEWLGKWQTPKLLLYAQPGANLRNLVDWCKENIANLKSVEVGAGVHYLQETDPHGIGEAIAHWMREGVKQP